MLYFDRGGGNNMTWLQFTPKPFKNVNHIFPTQQMDVYNLIQASITDKNIQKIIVFGSSVTKACNPWSDIDVYFEKKKEGAFPVVGSDSAVYDKWDNFSVSKDLLKEIKKKGVVVYER